MGTELSLELNQAELLKQFCTRSFWQSLCPNLKISETSSIAERSDFGKDKTLRSEDWDLCKELINEDAYFVYDSWFRPELIDSLAECFLTLESASIHPIFAFVYDEFWELLLQLDPMLSDLIGDYLLLPAVWSWFVRHSNQTAFAPHRDQVRDVAVDEDDHLDYLTIWIPLTDLNHLSSTMCVLPASLDSNYDEGTADIRVENLQDVRSLQGKRGSVFCWTTGLAHWGTTQSRFGKPRMSVGFYVQEASAECIDGPPLDLTVPLTLANRIRIIGQQIIDYSREADEDFLRLAIACTKVEETSD